MATRESAGSILAGLAQAQAAQAAQSMQYPPPWQALQNPNPAPTEPTLAGRAREMFLKRMGGIRAEMKVQPTDFLQCHVTQDMVFVFFCFSGKEGVIKEPIDMFPSDPLIAQFRMILI